MEIWKTIKNYKDFYQVSNLGNVKSLNRFVKQRKLQSGKKQLKKEKLVKPENSNAGYLRVALTKGGVQKKYLIHRLVAEAFIWNPYNKDCVNHINGNKSDNRIENLEWVTRSENQIHAIQTGLQKRKITEKEIEEIKMLFRTGCFYKTQIARMYNVTSQYICQLVNP